jgi:hypothetical protein
MNQSAMRLFVRNLILEAKEKKEADKAKAPKKAEPKKDKKPKKVSGNLVEMKKSLAEAKEKSAKIDELIADWEQVKSAADGISYGGEGDIEIGADAKEKIIADCDKEIEKLKKEKASLEEEMASLEESTLSEINKIKEMMGLKPKEEKGQKKMVDEVKPKSPSHEETAANQVYESRFKKGTDIGKKGPGFAKIEKAAAKKYGSEEAGKKVAGAILKKVVKK